ncbi:MAG: ABC transporter ATP-binding protein [Firmicutes bacterium]|nr:ABC transporter ATP-binding protein [Bacillota bacterium]
MASEKAGSAGRSPLGTLVRLLRLGRPYWAWYVGLVLLTTVLSGLDVALMEALRRLINAATEKSMALLKSGLIMSVAVFGTSEILWFVVSYYGELLDHVSIMRLQSKLVEKMTRVRLGALQKYHSGDLISRIADSAGQAQSGLNSRARQMLHQVLSIIVTMAYLTHLDWGLSVGTLGLSVLLPAIVTPLSKVLRETYSARQKVYAQKDSFIQDSVQGAEVVRAFSLANRLARKFRDIYQSILGYSKKALVLNLIVGHTQYLVIVGGIIFVLGYGGLQVARGTLDLGGLVVFLFCFERVAWPLSQLVRAWPEFQNSIAQADRVFELLDLPDEHYEQESADLRDRVRADREARVEFRDVRFGYEESSEVLKGISLVAEAGQVTALVGPSGSGKSTVLKLLLRLYEPSDGSILCQGMPIDRMTVGDWRSLTAYVSQDPFLFSGTLLENIRYGKPGATEDEVIAAARAANIHDFIVSTDDGYQTKVGERGVRLSGGQRQRVSIARAILRDPLILILDEPTSSLDSESELAVQQALDTLMKGRTTLVVAHRLSTVRHADKIAYLEDGVIKETGTHDELIKLRGRYYEMHQVLLSEPGERSDQPHEVRREAMA